MMNKVKNNKRGFTLVELLVVVSILGILSAVAFNAVSGADEEARATTNLSRIQSLQSAVDTYLITESPNFPSSWVDTLSLGTSSDGMMTEAGESAMLDDLKATKQVKYSIPWDEDNFEAWISTSGARETVVILQFANTDGSGNIVGDVVNANKTVADSFQSSAINHDITGNPFEVGNLDQAEPWPY